MDRIFDTLERIRTLWTQLGQLRPNTREYETLLNQIRTLSAEYQKLIDAPKKPSGSK